MSVDDLFPFFAVAVDTIRYYVNLETETLIVAIIIIITLVKIITITSLISENSGYFERNTDDYYFHDVHDSDEGLH